MSVLTLPGNSPHTERPSVFNKDIDFVAVKTYLRLASIDQVSILVKIVPYQQGLPVTATGLCLLLVTSTLVTNVTGFCHCFSHGP